MKIFFASEPFATDYGPHLTVQEKEYAETLPPAQRVRYIQRRGFLRSTLAEQLNRHPAELKLGRSRYGKPYLINHAIHFSFSHSHQALLLAISPDGPIGVDIEYSLQSRPVEKLAKRFFTQSEFDQLIAQPLPMRNRFFYQLWTSKEAFVKAIDRGFSALPFKDFSIEIIGEMASLLDWKITWLTPHPDYISAIAIQNKKI